MTTTIRNLKAQIEGETRVRVAAEARAAKAEQRERELDRELHRLRDRVAELEAHVNSKGLSNDHR